METRSARRAWKSQGSARDAAIRLLGRPTFDYLEASFCLYGRASREARVVISPYTDVPRGDRFRRAVLAAALDSAISHALTGADLGQVFNPAGLAYFGIAVGLDPVPREAEGKDEVRSAALVFKDRKNLWRQMLREEIERRKNVTLRRAPIESDGA